MSNVFNELLTNTVWHREVAPKMFLKKLFCDCAEVNALVYDIRLAVPVIVARFLMKKYIKPSGTKLV